MRTISLIQRGRDAERLNPKYYQNQSLFCSTQHASLCWIATGVTNDPKTSPAQECQPEKREREKEMIGSKVPFSLPLSAAPLPIEAHLSRKIRSTKAVRGAWLISAFKSILFMEKLFLRSAREGVYGETFRISNGVWTLNGQRKSKLHCGHLCLLSSTLWLPWE